MIDFTSLSMAVGSMGGLGALFAMGLAIADKKLAVEEDPRVLEITGVLPNANCGGCGYPGCGAFANAVVEGVVEPNGCPVATPDVLSDIGSIMGVEVVHGERQIARVLCQGGKDKVAYKAEYRGGKTCASASLASGGEKLCSFSCLGYGDCVKACPFDAMYMDDNGLPVIIESKCTGCGNCVAPCPRNIIELHPESHKLFVACKNKDDARYSRTLCIHACTACNLCVKNGPEGSMVMENNLAVVQYDRYGTAMELPTQKCATGCLVLLGEDGKFYASTEEMEKAGALTTSSSVTGSTV